MLWFYGSLAVVALVALVVGLNAEVVFTAKLTGLLVALIVGTVVGAWRDGTSYRAASEGDPLIVPKLFMFAMAAISILVGAYLVDLINTYGVRFFSQGVSICFSGVMVVFLLATGASIGMYWNDRPAGTTVRTAIATCAIYLLPAIILTPMVIYI